MNSDLLVISNVEMKLFSSIIKDSVTELLIVYTEVMKYFVTIEIHHMIHFVIPQRLCQLIALQTRIYQ